MNAGDQSGAADLRRLILGYRLSQALHVAARLGLADFLKDGPMSVDELARAAGAHPEALYRLMRVLASEGIFAESERRRFELTPLAMPLRSDVPGSLRARAILDGEQAHWQAWGHLMHSVATGEPAFDRAHGASFFEYMKAHAAVAASFNTVMTDQNAAVAQAVVEAYDFSGLGRLVDVGGGHGSLLAAIRTISAASRHPL